MAEYPSGLVKLNGDKNFSLWKFEFKTFIESKGLLDYLDGTNIEPSNHNSEQWRNWRKNATEVSVYLLSSMDSNVKTSDKDYFVHTQGHPDKLWKRVNDLFTVKVSAKYYDDDDPESW